MNRKLFVLGWLAYSLAAWGTAVHPLPEGLAAPSKSGTTARNKADLPLFRKQHEALHAGFAKELAEIAVFCDEKKLDAEAAEIRALAIAPDVQRLQMSALPKAVRADVPLDLGTDERTWRVRLRHAQQEYAKDLYLLSRRVLHAGYVSYAYDLIREAAWQDPDNSAARKLLGYVRHGDEWVTAYTAQMLRGKFAWTNAFGWLPKEHVVRYENGERFIKGRWVSAAQEAEVRRDFKNAWEIKTEHYLVKTNYSLERGVELARQLEDYYEIFFQTFAGFFNSRDQLKKLFEGSAARPSGSTRFEVHYYRTRDEYNTRLKAKSNQPIEITTGMYFPSERTAYFFHDKEFEQDAATTLFHEATHQLFSETRPSKDPVGAKANFWIIEGIACYMESFLRENDELSLGNPKYIRFRAAQYRYVNDKYYIPLAKFAAMGMNEFQSAPNIEKNYSQASGLVHFLMHYEGGMYREALSEHLSDIYSLNRGVRENPRSLETITGVDYAELDRQYGEYIRQLGQPGLDSAAKPAANSR